MSTCCIGGVCIPYSAIVPFLLMCLKWGVGYLKSIFVAPVLTNKIGNTGTNRSSRTCCSSTTLCEDELKSMETTAEFDNVLSSRNKVIVKFTASWCRPCQQIQPLFNQLSAKSRSTEFLTADADDLDEIAARYKIAILPTFAAFHSGKLVGKYVGSNEEKLKAWVSEMST
ncbi:predicted protein [Phaeodactylum tricornutum CCAP 1055/1]|uniref:Thioredoxin domain-containing protein n=2 Tax=Phaeodactylum tricornutum (strain CCAP 1055/1) TaxID=556484 RepID=B7G644_PHATC|nr:predicted protein [Phaeodactylum tricornutum CCAP 1055/1]EEC45947.1 predicted protein [Phaeodactylum tricornutum CCAP 1055/1]|eukprot:XP_002182660.1 predicted protein [Phaeodactylum tricornutum CCAP 1055/1]